jgi:hypothetical protein
MAEVNTDVAEPDLEELSRKWTIICGDRPARALLEVLSIRHHVVPVGLLRQLAHITSRFVHSEEEQPPERRQQLQPAEELSDAELAHLDAWEAHEFLVRGRQAQVQMQVQVHVQVPQQMSATFRMAIRSDDLQLLDAVVAGVTGLVTVASLTNSPGSTFHSTVTGVAAALLKLLHRVVRKGARLNPLQVQILLALKASAGGIELSQLVEKLNANLSGNDEWTRHDVLAELGALEKVQLLDGTVAAFVTKDANDLYTAAGV